MHIHHYENDQQHLIEEFVKLTFLHHPQHRLYFDCQVLAEGINCLYHRKILEVEQVYQVLIKCHRQPSTLQQYQTPLLLRIPEKVKGCTAGQLTFAWIKREGYPFYFDFNHVFTLTDMQLYGLSDLTDLLNQLNIPY